MRTGSKVATNTMWRFFLRAVSVIRQLSTSTVASPMDELSLPAVRKVFDENLRSQAERSRAQVSELIQQFQQEPGDTGSTPVQVAVLTFRIKHLTEHVKTNRKDFSCQRSLVKMVHRRRKLLRYLERTDHLMYQSVLQRLHIRVPKPLTYPRTKS